jgi:hypothetical protein
MSYFASGFVVAAVMRRPVNSFKMTDRLSKREYRDLYSYATVVVDLRTSYFRTELVNLVFIPPDPFDQPPPHHYRRGTLPGHSPTAFSAHWAEARACDLAQVSTAPKLPAW